MIRKISIILFLLTAISSLMADSITLDLKAVIQMASERNMELQVARKDIDTARTLVLEAKGHGKGEVLANAEYLHLNDAVSIKSPPVTFPAELGDLIGLIGQKLGIPISGDLPSITVPPTQVAPQDIIHLTLQAGYPLYTGGRVKNAIKQADYAVAAKESVASDTESAVMYESAGYYLGSILAREVYNVNNEALQSYTKHLEHAEIAYKTGIVAKYDVIRAETALKEQEKCVVEAQNRYKLALAALKTAIGIDQSSDITLTGSFFDANEPMSVQQAVETAYKQNAILNALDNKAGVLQAGKDFEKSDRKPIVKAVSQVELLTGNIAQTDPDWFIGVQANVKIFDGGLSKARIAGKQSEQERVVLEKKAAEDKISLAIQSAYLDMDSAKSSLESSRKASELAAESLRLASKRFEVGTGTSLEVLDANLSLSAAKIGEYQSMHMMDMAYLKLHRYLNDISVAAQEAQK